MGPGEAGVELKPGLWAPVIGLGSTPGGDCLQEAPLLPYSSVPSTFLHARRDVAPGRLPLPFDLHRHILDKVALSSRAHCPRT